MLTDLQSRNERMFLITLIVMNVAKSKRKLDSDIFAASGIAQKYNCVLTRLDYQQEQGVMSSLPLGLNQIEIQRALTTSSTAIFVPFTTSELFVDSPSALYYGLNALSNNLIMADRKRLKNPNGLFCKGRLKSQKTEADRSIAVRMDSYSQARNGNNTTCIIAFHQRKRRNTSIFYIAKTENAMVKGATTMQTAVDTTARTHENDQSFQFTKQFGPTTFVVSVHFSKASSETMEDKILRLMQGSHEITDIVGRGSNEAKSATTKSEAKKTA